MVRCKGGREPEASRRGRGCGAGGEEPDEADAGGGEARADGDVGEGVEGGSAVAGGASGGRAGGAEALLPELVVGGVAEEKEDPGGSEAEATDAEEDEGDSGATGGERGRGQGFPGVGLGLGAIFQEIEGDLDEGALPLAELDFLAKVVAPPGAGLDQVLPGHQAQELLGVVDLLAVDEDGGVAGPLAALEGQGGDAGVQATDGGIDGALDLVGAGVIRPSSEARGLLISLESVDPLTEFFLAKTDMKEHLRGALDSGDLTKLLERLVKGASLFEADGLGEEGTSAVDRLVRVGGRHEGCGGERGEGEAGPEEPSGHVRTAQQAPKNLHDARPA
ncbi:MAG: hypothetical protein MUF64_11495 [Polyangiaceae bacterium]|nr:hypothetical protein [Polyangiaceae bacterium]